MELQVHDLMERVRELEAEQRRQARRLRFWQGGLVALAALCFLLQSPGSRPAQADPPGAGGVPRLEDRITDAEKKIAVLDQRVTDVEQGLDREIQDRLKQVFSVQNRLARLEFLLECVERVGDDLFFVGCNVHIRNGLGATNGNPDDPRAVLLGQTATTGLGNLIIGYNELRGRGDDRTGSHNLVVGQRHNFSSFGGLLAGRANAVIAPYGAVSGGDGNIASGIGASVNGGALNHAGGLYASVSGGQSNQAGDFVASVAGGRENVASATGASVSGGVRNTAGALHATVGGGAGVSQGTGNGWAAGNLGGQLIIGNFRSP